MQNSKLYESLSLKKPLKPAKKLNFAVPSFIDNQDKLRIYNYIKTGNRRVLNEILKKYRPFILKYVRKYNGYLNKSNIIEKSDLIAEAEIAFIESLNKFDFNQGSSLSSFAVHYIEGALREFVMKSSFNVKISNSAAFKHLFFKINIIKERIGNSNFITNYQDIKNIKNIADVSEKQINNILNIIQNKSLNYCEQEEDYDDSNRIDSKINEISKINENIFKKSEEKIEKTNLNNFRVKLIKEALDELDKIDSRQKEILYSRFFKEKNKLEYLSNKYNLSLQRISFIEKQAIKNLKKIFFKKNIQSVELF